MSPPLRDVALFGAAGYSGLELAKLLEDHPHFRIACAASDAHAGTPVAALTGRAHAGDPVFVTTAAARVRALDCALALLAVPPEGTLAIAPSLRAAGVTVIDLSHAYRADASVPYGLTSLAAASVAGAGLVANPGCYATAVITAAAPLVAGGHLADGLLVANGASGVTGAGRKADEALSLGEMYGEVRAYRVLAHQHTAEIERTLAGVAGAGRGSPHVVLTTHLLPVARGILVTLTGQLAAPITSAELLARYRALYADDPTVVVQPTPEAVTLRRVVGTPTCHVSVATSDRGAVVAIAALDNLLKGAASQAIENANLALGLPRMAGLGSLARHA